MNSEMDLLDAKIQGLSEHAWDSEIKWPTIVAWRNNFTGEHMGSNEQMYGMYMLTKFMYFSKGLVREMLKSLYRDRFEGPEIQRIRRNCGGTLDSTVIRSQYQQRLLATRFIGVGNPSESGAHLLYYFRQVNDLAKDLFSDFHRSFAPRSSSRSLASTGEPVAYEPRESGVSNYVFFDDLVGSGTQVSEYLSVELASLRRTRPDLQFSFLCLFATNSGIRKLNGEGLFNGRASALFELDDSFRAFESESRYFKDAPAWFDMAAARGMVSYYGEKLYQGRGLGFRNGQLLMGFSHNTPDNVPCLFWCPGRDNSWSPVFLRYDKNYEEVK